MKYVIKFLDEGESYKGLYYGDRHWGGVPRSEARQLSHKKARAIQGKLWRPGIRLKTKLVPVS